MLEVALSAAFSVSGIDSVKDVDELLSEIRFQDTLESLGFDEVAGQVEIEQDYFDTEPPFSDR